jgi:hypothetical protein
MTNPTSNFGWQMPTPTDLVTDLPADFEVFGQAVDTALADLKGGTTGQVLAKASNTNMDFSWVAQDDSNAIQNTIVDAKGDLIAASASDVPARLAVGNNGETLVADSSTSTGLRYKEDYAAGKNKIINGDMNIWQRGTSFTPTNNTYTADRWGVTFGGSGTLTCSRQTFTPGSAPVAGYESQYFLRMSVATVSTISSLGFFQGIENVTTFAGQTVTFSFWAKADSARTLVVGFGQAFGTGGSSFNGSIGNTSISVTTSWARYSATIAIPSISGKTIGTVDSALYAYIFTGQASGLVVDIWGVQVEESPVATAFQTATGTIQGELAACQRYYWRNSSNATANFASFGTGLTQSATAVICSFINPVPMRVAATSVDFSTLNWNDGTNTSTITAMTVNAGNSNTLITSTAATTTFGTQYRPVTIQPNNSSTAFIGFSAEL